MLPRRAGPRRRAAAAVALGVGAALVAAAPGASARGLDGAAGARLAPAAPAAWQQAPSLLGAACRTPDPYAALAILGRPGPGTTASQVPAILVFRHGDGTEPPDMLSSRADVGDVYGLAYDHARGCLYAAAYHRAGGAYGPAGPGAIYRIDMATGQTSVLATLDVGADLHAAGDPAADRAGVGRASLGDLALAENGSELYVADLYADQIVRIALPGGQIRDRMPHGGDRSAGARVFGLAARSGWLYQAVAETKEVTRPLEVGVYRSLPGMRDSHQVLAFGLDYARTFQGVQWRAWRADSTGSDYDSAMAVDLAFRSDGAPIVGLRDRVADMVPGSVWAEPDRAGPSVGDIVPSRLGTDGLTWEAVRQPPWYQDSGPDNIDVTFGALARVPGTDIIVSAGRSRAGSAAEVVGQLAVYWFSNDSGSVLRWRTLLDASGSPSGQAAIEDLATGDIEALCAPADQVDPDLLATGTAEARAAATARASEAAVIRATEHSATQTAVRPIQDARHTAAAATAEVVVPALTAEAPTQMMAATLAAGTATAVAPTVAALAPTADALATRRARATALPEATTTAAAANFDRIKGTCGTGNPYMVTARFVPRLDGNGAPYSPYWLLSQAAVLAFNDTQPQDTSRHVNLAVEPEVGAVYGVAYDLTRDQAYVGAYAKRLSGFGPLGPGGIYRIDLRTGALDRFAMLPAGSDPHALRTDFDLAAASFVGRAGLGDIEMAEDGSQLFAVNLHDKLIYRLSVPDGRLLGVFPNGAAGLPWAADAAPFALAVRSGWLYHGVIDPGSEGTVDPPSTPRRPFAYVYRSRPDGGDMSEVVRLDLNYGRAPSWQVWQMTVPENTSRPEAMLSDIEFRLDGDLVLGLRDRAGDARILTAGYGDMVLTMRVGDSGSGERFIPLTIPEVYQDNIRHAESSWGGLAALPWLDETVSNVIDPVNIYSGGAAWFDNAGGGTTRLEEVYAGANQTYGKASGMGDIEALCVALTPTPSLTPSATPTRAATSTASATARPTQTPSATPTATPGHYRIYLPMARRDRRCVPQAAHSDVVLVLDMSTSMYRRTLADRTKHEAALDAARRFAELVAFTADESGGFDQIGVVGFNDLAWIEQPLTNDGAAVAAAIERLPSHIQEGTRIDLALREAVRCTQGPSRRPGNQAVVILLTDGLPNRVPTPVPSGSQEQTVEDTAAAAKAQGIRLFTVGLGEPDDVLRPLLERCASDKSMYYYAPDGEDLAAIYRAIAGRIVSCP